jgi:hypothetical protein
MILARKPISTNHRGCAIVRRLGVAAASAALIATIAAVVPAGPAHGDISGTALPTPIGNLCSAAEQATCWRATSILDVAGEMHGVLPAVSGDKLVLNAAAEKETANAVWWNTPITITGQAIEVSFNAYFDQGFQTVPIPAHGEGLTFALVEGDATGLGDNNHPAPIPFNPASSSTEYGAGGNGLGFGGFDGNNTTPSGGVNNENGDKNLALALLTSNDDANDGGDVGHDVSRVGLLKGLTWPNTTSTGDPHVRTGRWYTGSAATVATQIYGGRPVPVTLSLYPKTGVPNTWVAHVTVDGVAKVDSDVELPPTVFMGFTEGTHEFPQRHAISDVSIKYGTQVAPPTGGAFNPVTPDRILDTRVSGGPIGPGGTRPVKVTGAKGVPEGAGAVVLNATVTEPTAPGFITIYPTGSTRPTASNLNFVPGQNIANLVTAKVGVGGQVDIYNFAGDTQVVFDVVGWFPSEATAATSLSAQATGGEFVPLSPSRILDTRSAIGAPVGPLGPNTSLDLQVAGRGGVPINGAAAVVINLTATETTDSSFLTAWPTGSQRTTSNVNFTAGTNTPNLAVVPLGTGGKVSVYNFAGNAHVLADVVGYYTASGVSAGGGLFHAMVPNRFVDTRPEANNLTLTTGGVLRVQIRGVKGIPAGAVGVVMNVTATNTTQDGFLTVFPTGEARPGTSSLNFVPGQSVPNLAMAKLGADGSVSIYNFAGPTDVIVDVVGWYGTA